VSSRKKLLLLAAAVAALGALLVARAALRRGVPATSPRPAPPTSAPAISDGRPPEDLNPCEGAPHHYDPGLQIHTPLCLNDEPLAAPLTLPDGHIYAPFLVQDLASGHPAYWAHLLEGRRKHTEAADDGFAVLDVNESDERLFAVGRCPKGLLLGAMAAEQRSRLHVLCRESGGSRDPVVAHGVFDEKAETFRWDEALSVSRVHELSSGWLALGMVGNLPILVSGGGAVAVTRFLRPKAADHPVEFVYGLFTTARGVTVIHADAEAESPRYLRLQLDVAGGSRDSPITVRAAREAGLPADAAGSFTFPADEPPVLVVARASGELLPLPELQELGLPPPEPQESLALSVPAGEPIGGPRSSGDGLFVQNEEHALAFDCGNGRRITLSRSDTRLSRASCSERSCVITYFEPLQPFVTDGWLSRWSTRTFFVRRIDRATCADRASSR
jgi:hypothetical protein